jgi:hypothetical protein
MNSIKPFGQKPKPAAAIASCCGVQPSSPKISFGNLIEQQRYFIINQIPMGQAA